MTTTDTNTGGGDAGGGEQLDLDRLNELIDSRAREMLDARIAELTPPAGGAPPATKTSSAPAQGSPSQPAPSSGALDPGAIAAAVEKALGARDDRDRVLILEGELEKVKSALADKAAGTGKVARNWASLFLGMGSGRGYR